MNYAEANKKERGYPLQFITMLSILQWQYDLVVGLLLHVAGDNGSDSECRIACWQHDGLEHNGLGCTECKQWPAIVQKK